MAERRMLSKSLLMDNLFLSLTNDSKTLYLYLLMFADDDGIVKRSMMIDSVIKVDDSNYKELEENGLIIPYNDQVKVITHWNNLQTIRGDIYKQTAYLEFRSQLYIKADYSYTKNGDDKEVFSSADNWVKNGRPKDIKDFKPLINKYFRDRNGIRNDDRNVSKVKYSKDKVSIDKNSTVQSSSGQQRSAKSSKDIKYINSSSNGGMGEDASLTTTTSTSTKDNNATREIKPSTPNSEKQSNKQSNNQEEANILLNYINAVANTNIPTDDKRLLDVLNKLITNGYEVEDVKIGIDNVVDTIKQMPQYNTPQALSQLLVQHLAEYTRTALEKNNNEE